MSSVYWIIEYGSTFLECFLCSIFCGTFIDNTDLKMNQRRRYIISAVMSGVMLLINNIELYSPITGVIGFLLLGLTQYMIYYHSPVKAPILAVLFLLILTVIDNIVVSMMSYFLEIPITGIYAEMSMNRVNAIIISKTLLMIITVVINKLFARKNTLKTKYLIVLFAVTVLMYSMIVMLIFIDIKNKTVDSYVSILFFAVMLILLMIIFFGTFKLTEYYDNQQQLQLTMLRNKMLEQSMNETEQTFMMWKTSMHDFKHNIMNLTALAENNDIQGIKEYLEKENELLGKKLFYYKTGNDTVDTILNIKQKVAENMGITFIINAEIPEKCNVTSADFASILGNLLDNAIEASEHEEDPFIEMKIKSVKEYLVISILNKYTKNDMSLETSKLEKHFHGIGLYSVGQVVKRYGGELTIEKKDDIFNVKIMIPM